MTQRIEDLRDWYVFGEPVETKYGNVRFLTYKEYLMNSHSLSLMSMNVLHIYHEYRKTLDLKNQDVQEALEEMKSLPLFTLISQLENFKKAYEEILSLVIEDESLTQAIISDEKLFYFFRTLILDMQMIQEAEVAESEIVQEFIEKSRRVKMKNAEKQSVFDITSSIVASTGISYAELANMTVLQVYSTYYRIGALKNYDTSTLFATISEKVTIENWNRSIDLFEKETAGMKASEFNKNFGGLFE